MIIIELFHVYCIATQGEIIPFDMYSVTKIILL